MGLLDAFKQYLSDAMPGGLLNPEWGPYMDRIGETMRGNLKRRDDVMKWLLADPSNPEIQRQAMIIGLLK